MSENFVYFFTVAAAYFYFNCSFLFFIETYFEEKEKGWTYKLLVFVINYALFTICSFLQWNLIVNWFVFFVAVFFEIRFLYHLHVMATVYFSYSCVITGLALNLVFRCLFALVWDKPLELFDNHILYTGNLKRYPVLLGFAVAGLAFHIFKNMKIGTHSRVLLKDLQSVFFLVSMQTVLYMFLLLNLLPFSLNGNSIIMKLWGLKSSLFALIGLRLSIFYSVRTGELNQIEIKSRQEREMLLKEKREEEKIRIIAFSDPLTGCYNRQYADYALNELWEKGCGFTIVFADLNGLKQINDIYGHLEGDRYLKEVSADLKDIIRGDDLLIRYGGDEFLVVFPQIDLDSVSRRIMKVNDQLKEWGMKQGFEYPVSISYGIVERNEAEDIKSLMNKADERMYQDKKSRMYQQSK